MQTTARHHIIGNAEAWFAHRGTKVLCDKRIRARRFKTAEAALKTGNAATDDQFY